MEKVKFHNECSKMDLEIKPPTQEQIKQIKFKYGLEKRIIREGEYMKRIGIIGAMPVEIEILKKELKDCFVETYAGLNYYLGKIKDIEIVLLECGIGKVNAAIYTQILIDKYSVDAIINTGIAGGLSDDVKHLSIVISKQLTYYDVRKIQMINCFPNQEFFKADANLIDLAAKISESNNLDYHIGTIISGEDFISDTERKRKLYQIYKAICIEMEGTAIAHTAFVNQIPFLVIRCISDLANEAATEDYKNFEILAAHESANLVKEMICHI
ncbi:5'-methylthioadenosine/adenosylhomocysteine nucleosidase [Abyssisolibacter fermentans]|uniref:5'-methylthioadenosine/adenosylhomocysteine nucleosidase n=1 Tax=Abyssisolibacter fermentans TaxID=1766203 RepID=UPI000A5E1B57|nr:5'-methylthioadenosine/adenosylhomocysteine nucleosidase [Abyssisolibacter fermentans]